ncbi:MAG: AraC family transcriptional regulator [Lachnospiraceae bacterium]
MSILRYNAIKFASDELSQVKLLYISTSKYEHDWHSTLHSHHCTELFYVLNGKGTFRIENLVFPVCANDIIIANPNVKHTEIAIPHMPLEYIVLGLDGGEFIAAGTAESRYCMMHLEKDNNILFFLRQIIAELEKNSPYHQLAAQNFLEILIINLLRHKSLFLSKQSKLVNETGTNTECSQVKRYIDTHYKEQVTLDILAEKSHFSKYYLVHMFTKEYGISPINYLNQKRVEESCYFLANTDYSISDIARILGFSSLSYFSQSFTRSQAMSPRAYRLQNKRQKTDEHKTQGASN